MKSLAYSLAAVAALASIPSGAHAFRAINGFTVNPVNAYEFEVIPHRLKDNNDYWCAAANYLNRELRLPWNTRMYVVSGIGPGVTSNRRDAVRFTVDPAASGIEPRASGGVVTNILGVGYGRSGTAANRFCVRDLTYYN